MTDPAQPSVAADGPDVSSSSDPEGNRHGWLSRQLGTLALSHVHAPSPMAPIAMTMVRAASWANHLSRLGLHLPLFVVRDLGLLCTAPPDTITIAPRSRVLDALGLAEGTRLLLSRYQELLTSIGESDVVREASSWRLRDELVAVLVARILGDLFHSFGDPGKAIGVAQLPLDPAVYQAATPEALARHYADFDRAELLSFVRFLVDNRLRLYTAVEQIDVDTLKLLGLLGNAESGAVDLVDLHGVFQSGEGSDVVDFSLELLPSVLETRRASGVQSFAVDGYASIERKGSPDSLLLTEFAWDAELFERKVVDDELYYYGRERQRDEKRRLSYLLVDSSPSMRGVRQVFARGLALALAKKLSLQGDEVWLRFFDSRLYEIHKVGGDCLAVPHLLTFKSERGRNYGKVFRQLLVELSRLRREDGRQLVVYIVTHGQCHVAAELVTQLAAEARLYGIFILPSSELALDYLPALHRHQIVDAHALASREGRKNRALDILADAGRVEKVGNRDRPRPR